LHRLWYGGTTEDHMRMNGPKKVKKILFFHQYQKKMVLGLYIFRKRGNI